MEETSYEMVKQSEAYALEDAKASSHALPAFDVSKSSQITSLVAIGCGTLFSVVCIIASSVYLAKNPKSHLVALGFRGSGAQIAAFEIIPLFINLALTLTTDSLAFVHSVSLRWALCDEGRLQYNTNIRLLTSSRRSGPNRWWINALSLMSLMLCYGATSVLYVKDIMSQEVGSTAHTADRCLCCSSVCANMVALMVLGLGLAIQTAVAAWCLVANMRTYSHRGKLIPTWSSNPLNATLTGLHRGLVVHRPGRCLVSVHQQDIGDEIVAYGVSPVARQGNAWQTHHTVRYVVYFLWGLAVVAVAWPIIIVLVVQKFYEKAEWYWEPNNWNAVILAMSTAVNRGDGGGGYFSYEAELVLGLLFATLIQSAQTAGLHCTELLVNLSRDEAAWRRATKKNGATYQSSPFYAALTSWENIILFVAKSALHWVIGQSLLPEVGLVILGSQEKGSMFFVMSWSRLIIYSACAVFMAAYVTFLALRKPKGPQPATWGHLQTLADLIDDWKTDEQGKFWWGDKTNASPEELETISLRHAGMSDEREMVRGISMESKYAGDGLTKRKRA